MFIIKENVKLIPIKNPNFNIQNDIESLIEMLKGVFIVEGTKGIEENIIGVIDKNSKFYYDDENIYGNIIFSDGYNNYEFVNYECKVDKKYYIVKFNAIYFGRKEIIK